MHKIVVPGSSCIPSLRPKQNLNWEKCYIFQDDKLEKLTCRVLFEESAVGKNRDYNALDEYQKVEQMINKLDSTGKTIPGLDNFSLDDDNGIAQTLFSRKAGHHRSWRQKIISMRIAQAEVFAGRKRKLDEKSEQINS